MFCRALHETVLDRTPGSSTFTLFFEMPTRYKSFLSVKQSKTFFRVQTSLSQNQYKTHWINKSL